MEWLFFQSRLRALGVLMDSALVSEQPVGIVVRNTFYQLHLATLLHASVTSWLDYRYTLHGVALEDHLEMTTGPEVAT